MAVKKFAFRQNWVSRKVVGTKKTFFAIFDPTWIDILPQKAQIRVSLNHILVKKDINYIIINFVTLRLTNYFEIIKYYQFFAIFDPNWAKIWP